MTTSRGGIAAVAVLWVLTASPAVHPYSATPHPLVASYVEQMIKEPLLSAPSQISALSTALGALNQIALDGGWVFVTGQETLKLGMVSAHVQSLATRLGIATDDEHDMIFDHHLEQVVIAYQARHGLEADGIVGRTTRQHLNVDIHTRIDQVQQTLNRWHQLPLADSADYIIVNIPDFQLRYYDGHEETLAMRVVVGKRSSPTPLMQGNLEYLVFNPYWDLPRRITKDEMLPKIVADPAYLSQKRLEVLDGGRVIDPMTIDWSNMTPHNFPFKLRQQPGKDNSLGSVKFIFPNPEFIYLHDTPGQHAFSESRRMFSHGCVRVEHADQLAHAVLTRQNGWSERRAEQRLSSKATKGITLRRSLPVYITYHRARVDGEGELSFFNDVYDLDGDFSKTELAVARQAIP